MIFDMGLTHLGSKASIYWDKQMKFKLTANWKADINEFKTNIFLIKEQQCIQAKNFRLTWIIY